MNYRTPDEETCATMIERELSHRFGAHRVVRSTGADHIDELRASSVLLVVIGGRWLSFADDHGNNALDLANDRIRTEIVAAFEADIPVVPILLGRTERLRRIDLPIRLARLADCHYLRLDIGTAERDLRHLGDALVDIVPGLVEVPETVGGEPKQEADGR